MSSRSLANAPPAGGGMRDYSGFHGLPVSFWEVAERSFLAYFCDRGVPIDNHGGLWYNIYNFLCSFFIMNEYGHASGAGGVILFIAV
jgi:hypothetical protein